MRNAAVLIVTYGFFSGANLFAQNLTVRNTDDETRVIMEWYPQNQPQLKGIADLGPGETKTVELRGEDPFFVTHRLKGEQSVAPKIYTDWGIRLRESFANAKPPRTWDVDFTFHEDRRGHNIQVMSATLRDPTTGDEFKIFDQADNLDLSRLLNQVIEQKWRTTRTAPDGNVDAVQVDFKKLRFESQRIRGEFRDLCIGERDGKCYVVGRWWIKEGRHGDVHFVISGGNGSQISGHCTLDGDPQPKQYPWNSR